MLLADLTIVVQDRRNAKVAHGLTMVIVSTPMIVWMMTRELLKE